MTAAALWVPERRCHPWENHSVSIYRAQALRLRRQMRPARGLCAVTLSAEDCRQRCRKRIRTLVRAVSGGESNPAAARAGAADAAEAAE